MVSHKFLTDLTVITNEYKSNEIYRSLLINWVKPVPGPVQNEDPAALLTKHLHYRVYSQRPPEKVRSRRGKHEPCSHTSVPRVLWKRLGTSQDETYTPEDYLIRDIRGFKVVLVRK